MVEPLNQCRAIVLYQSPEMKEQAEMQRLFDRSLKAQFKDHSTFQKFGHGDIVVLVGTSTAGKSSIIKKLREVEGDRLEQGVDMASMRLVQQFMEKEFPEDVQFLKSVLVPKDEFMEVHNAVGGNVFDFKEGISLQDQEHAKEIAKKLDEALLKSDPRSRDEVEGVMLEEVFLNSLEGKSTIFDVLEIENIYRNVIRCQFSGPIRIALVYCPFKMLAGRMQERNRKAVERGDLFDVRAAPFPLFQFADLFGPKENDDDVVIETLTRQEVEEACDKTFDLGDHPVEEKERKETKEALLNKLGFTSPDIEKVELTPKQKDYHYLVDTSQFTPEQTVKKLRNVT